MPITGSAEAARPGRKDEAGCRPGRRPNGTGGEAGPRRRPSLPVPCPRAGTWADPRLLRSLFPTDGPPSSHRRAGSGSGACTSHPGRSRTCRPRFKSPRPPPRWPWEGSCDDLRPAAGAAGSSGEGHGLRPASCAPGLTDGATELLPEASSPVFAPVLSAQSPEQHPDPGPLPPASASPCSSGRAAPKHGCGRLSPAEPALVNREYSGILGFDVPETAASLAPAPASGLRPGASRQGQAPLRRGPDGRLSE